MSAALLFAAVLLAPAETLAGRGADGVFERRESSHFVLLQDVAIDESFGLRGSRRFEQQVLETLESAYVGFDARVGLRPRRPITVVVHDPALFDQKFTGLFRFPAAGFYQGTIHIRGDVQVTVSLVRVLHHEYAHAALDAVMPSWVAPGWFNEGLAEWFESVSVGKRLLSEGELRYLSGAASQGQLFSLAQLSAPSFAGFGPGAAQLAYVESYGFFEHLVRRFGERSLREAVLGIVRSGDLARSFRRAFRSDLARLETQYHEELGGRARR